MSIQGIIKADQILLQSHVFRNGMHFLDQENQYLFDDKWMDFETLKKKNFKNAEWSI